MKKNPIERLGTGAPGTLTDYKSLKEHPFFAGLNFDNLNTVSIPLDKKYNEDEIMSKFEPPRQEAVTEV